jgi:hypothetical protein
MGFFDSDVEYQGAYDLPTDYKSGLADILGEAKKLYEAKKETGYQTYEGPRIAGFTPEEQAAMTGIAGLVGTGRQYFDPATQYAKGLGEQFTADTAQSYMNPYQQSVVDVEKRKAREDFEQTMQGIGAKAVGAGGYGGSRQAVVEGEAIGDLGQRLGDIQAIGQKQAFDQARQAFEAQKARERQAGSALASLGQQAPQQALKELTALSGVGEAGRGMEQSKMDLAYKDFLERQGFAGDALEEYKSSLYKYPYQAYQKQTQGFSKPSSFQNLMGIVSAGAKVAPFLGFKEGGHIAFRSQGGLSGLTANYEDGTGASTVGSGTSYKQGLMDSLKNMMNLSSMSSDLTRLQELRTKIAESKAQKEIGKNTLLNAIGEFAQGVASSYDPTKPQTMAGSLAAGAGAVQERQDPDIIKAQTEAEALESGIKTKQAMAELTKDYIKAASDLGTDFEVADSNDLRKDVALKFGYKLNENKEIVKEDGTPLTQQASDKVFNMYKKALDKYLAFGGGAKGKQKAVEFIAGQSSLLTGLDGDNKGSSLDDKETQDYINKVEKEIDYK